MAFDPRIQGSSSSRIFEAAMDEVKDDALSRLAQVNADSKLAAKVDDDVAQAIKVKVKDKKKLGEHLRKKAGVKEGGEKETKTRPVREIAKDFAKQYPRHKEAILTSVRRLIAKLNSREGNPKEALRKLLKDIYQDNPLMHYEVLSFVETTYDSTSDISDEVKSLIGELKSDIQAELVAEGGESRMPTSPDSTIMQKREFDNLYKEVSGREVDPHEIFNKLWTLTKGDLHNLQQVAGPLLRRLSDDCRSGPEIDRALLQNRVQEIRMVVAISRVHLVFEESSRLVTKQYGAIA